MEPPEKEKHKERIALTPEPSSSSSKRSSSRGKSSQSGSDTLLAPPVASKGSSRSVSPGGRGGSSDGEAIKEKKEKKTMKENERAQSPVHRTETKTDSQADTAVVAVKPIQASILSSASARLEGWLAKQTASYQANAKAGWRQRYFILRHCCLFWYKMTPVVSLPSFALENCTCSIPSAAALPLFSSKFGYQLTINGNEGDSLLLAFESAAEQQSWVSLLSHFKPGDETADSLKKRGWVYRYAKSWKLRYVILRHCHLEFFEATEKGFWPLVHNNLEMSKDDKTFTVIAERGKRLPLKAGDARLWNIWTTALKEDIEVLSKEAATPLPTVDGQEANSTQQHHHHHHHLGTEMTRRVLGGKAPDVAMIKLLGRVRDTLHHDKLQHEALMKERALQHELHIPDAPKLRKRKLNILSFDGGGLRGIMGCIILERLKAEFPDLLDQFQVVAGCSNGAMLAMGLAFGVQPSGCRTLLEVTGESIFSSSAWISTPIKTCKFANDPLKLLCDETWGTKKLSDAQKYVLIPSFLLDNQNPDPLKREWRIAVHHNFSKDDPSSNELASDVVMRSAAAPTYFPSFQRHVDGGMWCHDPSSCALLMAMSRLKKKASKINLLSIGTGKVLYHIDAEPDIAWGMYQYLPWLSSMLWGGMVQRSENDCKELLGNRYWRVNPLLEKDIVMDNPGVLPILTKVAYEVDLRPTVEWIKSTLYS